MRHFTLASLTRNRAHPRLLTATPSMAQTAQPAAKSDSKMMAPGAEGLGVKKMAPGTEGGVARHQLGDRRPARRAAGRRQGLFGQDHRGPPLQGQGRSGEQRNIVPQKTYDGIKDKIIAKQKS